LLKNLEIKLKPTRRIGFRKGLTKGLFFALILDMKQFKIIIFSIFFILVIPSRALFALGPIPIENAEKIYDFNSSRIIDWDYSTVNWEKGKVTLEERDGNFVSSGVLWTDDIRFNPDIYSLTLTGIYSQPSGTHVLAFVSFDDDIREYPLVWGSPFEPNVTVRKIRLRIFLATSNPNLSPELNKLYLRTELKDLSENGPKNRDNKRVSNLNKMKKVLDKYYKYFNHYPIVSIKEEEKENQWDSLENILDSATLHYRENYKYGFKEQPEGVDNDYKYGYSTDKSGNNFLLWVKLEQAESKHLEDSWKEKTFNVVCESPTFCLSSIVSHEPDPLIRFFEEDEGGSGIDDTQFIKEKDKEKVYLNLNGFRLWLNAPDVFEGVGGVWDSIVNLGSMIQEIPLAKFIRAEGDEKIYLVSNNGTIRHMFSQSMIDVYGKFDKIITVGQEIIRALPQNYLIREEGGHKVYLLDQKIKRWITTPQILERLNFNFSDVVEVKLEEIKSYAEGTPIF